MMNRTLPRALFAALFATVLLASTPAWADDVSVTDPSGDGAPGYPDIVEAAAGHTDGGHLKHTVTADLVFATPSAPCIAIRDVYPTTEAYSICGDGKVRRDSDDAVTGTAGVTRPDNHTVVYTFGRKAIEGASTYRWRAETRDPTCDHDRCDVAPDTFRLHEEQITYQAWALKFLAAMDAGTCQSNRIAVVAWETNEGTAAIFNPLATTYSLPGSTKFNSTGVRNYLSLGQGVKGVRLTIERGWNVYGYGLIIKRLRACAPALSTAKAIRASEWCAGCSGGAYVTGLIGSVRQSFASYASRLIATH